MSMSVGYCLSATAYRLKLVRNPNLRQKVAAASKCLLVWLRPQLISGVWLGWDVN